MMTDERLNTSLTSTGRCTVQLDQPSLPGRKHTEDNPKKVWHRFRDRTRKFFDRGEV